MPSGKDNAGKKPEDDERMIEVKISFWTDDIATEAGNILPGHARSSGLVSLEANGSHGIVPESPKPFHSLMDISSALERVLIENGIVLHPSKKMKKYFPEE